MGRFLKILAAVALVGLTTGVVLTALALRWRAGSEPPLAASPGVQSAPPAVRLAAPPQPVAAAGVAEDAARGDARPLGDGPADGGRDGPRDAHATEAGDGAPPSPAEGVSLTEDAAVETGWLTVESRRRAVVRVGREIVGPTPLRRLALPPGRHAVVARNRHGVRRRNVTVERGAEVRVFFNL